MLYYRNGAIDQVELDKRLSKAIRELGEKYGLTAECTWKINTNPFVLSLKYSADTMESATLPQLLHAINQAIHPDRARIPFVKYSVTLKYLAYMMHIRVRVELPNVDVT